MGIDAISGDVGSVDTLAHDRQVEGLSNEMIDNGVNVAQLIVKVCLARESGGLDKAGLKVAEVEAEQAKLKTVVTFATNLETQLASKTCKEIVMTSQADLDLLAEVRKLMPNNPIFEKNSWTRDEAQAILQSITRHSQMILQQASHLSSELNRLIEEGYEVLQIARKIVEMNDRHNQTLIRNQRPN